MEVSGVSNIDKADVAVTTLEVTTTTSTVLSVSSVTSVASETSNSDCESSAAGIHKNNINDNVTPTVSSAQPVNESIFKMPILGKKRESPIKSKVITSEKPEKVTKLCDEAGFVLNKDKTQVQNKDSQISTSEQHEYTDKKTNDIGIADLSSNSNSSDATNTDSSFKVPILNTKKVTSVKEEKNSKSSAVLRDTEENNSSSNKGISNINVSDYYTGPMWGGVTSEPYSLEVLKNGAILNSIDITKKSFYVFGRLPACDIFMEHPSLSRFHAVIQCCPVDTQRHKRGWYLFDLKSTHGTYINKCRIKPKVYYRIRVGHMIKFAGSSRIYILQVFYLKLLVFRRAVFLALADSQDNNKFAHIHTHILIQPLIFSSNNF